MKVAAIHQPQYLPYWGFFDKLSRADVFVVLDHVQFQKNGLQNRNKIKGPSGWQWLTVPVIQKLGQSIRDVQIGDAKWNRKHIQTLRTVYGRAPHFSWCTERLFPVLERSWTRLAPLNVALVGAACELLEIDVPVVHSSELAVTGDASEMLIDVCRSVGADTYLSGPGGRGYMDLAAFERAGIGVMWQEFVHPTYDQGLPANEFQPNLSIVDILCCAGPAVRASLEPRTP